jgi:hypothetical protein
MEHSEAPVVRREAGNSVASAAPSLRPSAERNPLMPLRVMNGAPGKFGFANPPAAAMKLPIRIARPARLLLKFLGPYKVEDLAYPVPLFLLALHTGLAKVP